MAKALEIKRKHHYVWAFYLRQWESDEKGVWYRTPKNRISQDSPDGLSQQEDFYKLGELLDEDVAYIRTWPVPDNASLREFQEKQLRWFCSMSRIVHRTEDYKGKPEYSELKKLARAIEANCFENTHGAIETLALPVMKELIRGCEKCLSDKKFMTSFCHYLSHQLFRTKKIRDTTQQAMQAYPDGRELWGKYVELYRRNSWFLSYRNAISLAHSLLSTITTDRHVYVRNDTSVDFITTDHPVINIHDSALCSQPMAVPTGLDLYYPISPKYAYIISSSDRYNGLSESITEVEVRHLNKLMAEKAYRNIYATSRAGLKGLVIKP